MWKIVTCASVLALGGCRHGAAESSPGDAAAPPRTRSSQQDKQLFYQLGRAHAQKLRSEWTPEQLSLFQEGLASADSAPPVSEEDRSGAEFRLQWERNDSRDDSIEPSPLQELAELMKDAQPLEGGGALKIIEPGMGPPPGPTGPVPVFLTNVSTPSTTLLRMYVELDPSDAEHPVCLRRAVERLSAGAQALVSCPPEKQLESWKKVMGQSPVTFLVERPDTEPSTPPAASAPPAEPPKPEPLPPAVYRQVAVAAGEPFIGPAQAPVTVVAWIGPCEMIVSCDRRKEVLQRLRTKYAQQVRLVPRVLFKPEDRQWRLLAEQTLAIWAQSPERGWAHVERLLSTGQLRDEHWRKQLASESKVDLSRLREAMDLRLFKAPVLAQELAARALGLETQGTLLFINGREVREVDDELPSLEVMDRIVAQEKARAESLLASGTPRQQLYARLIEQGQAPTPMPAPTDKGITRFELSHSPQRGPATAPLTIVYFADFQDTASADAIPRLRWLERQYANRLRIVFKHRPSPEHPRARAAALAALAAHEQGRFWDYHDRLFAQPDALDDEALRRHARELGLDEQRFQKALDSGRLERLLEIDEREARWLEVEATPVAYVDHFRMYGVHLETLREAIDARLLQRGR